MDNQRKQVVNIEALETVNCFTCKKGLFEKQVMLKKLPAILSQNGYPQLLELVYYRCTYCGQVYSYEELLNHKNKEKCQE